MEETLLRTRRATGKVVLPPLGPAFISEEDAAHWAHRQIGDSRDREYGGVIMQRLSDGRFVATQPMGAAGPGEIFEWTSILERGADKTFISPDGYRLVASVLSRSDRFVAVVKRNKPGLPDRDIRAIVSFYTDGEIISNFADQDPFRSAYLSGLYGTLLRYKPSGTEAEKRFVRWLAEGGKKDSPYGHDGTVKSFFQTTASVGTLTFLISSVDWGGSVGTVPEDWEPYQAFEATRMQPTCSQIFSSLNAVRDHAQTQVRHSPDRQVVFLLKAVGTQAFVATSPVAATVPLYSVASLFPLRADGRPRLPSGFRLVAIFHTGQEDPQWLDVKQSWLMNNFFSPTGLAAAIVQSRIDTYLQDSEHGLTFYLQTRGNALLAYKCSNSATETAFASEQGKDHLDALRAGRMTPYEFVLKVAAAGELTVVETGNVWDEPGRVTSRWRPFERIHQSLGPVFLTADDAARHAQVQIVERRDDDYLGYVLERDDGRFVATRPIAGAHWTKGWGLPFAGGVSNTPVDLPGHRYAAFYIALQVDEAQERRYPTWSNQQIKLWATLPNHDYLVQFTSAEQLLKTFYCCGPEGSLIKYVASRSALEREFSDWLATAIKTMEIKRQLDGFDGTPEQMVKKMVRLGELFVVQSSPIWKDSRGKVPANWAPFQPFISATPLEPRLSQVFEHQDGVARAAHDRMRATPTERQVAFILKDPDKPGFVLTDPMSIALKVALPPFSALHAFDIGTDGKPHLPEGYAIQSICYFSVPDTKESRKEKWLYETFISPKDFAQALATSRLDRPSGFSLYISTRVNAQLHYEFSGSEQENQLYAITPVGLVTDNGEQGELMDGSLTPQGFIKRVAAAGTFSVIRTGGPWDVEGVVDQGWLPFARFAAAGLGPAFLSSDDAARYAHEKIGSQPGELLTGCILKRPDGRFTVTEPRVADLGCFIPGDVYPTDASGKAIVPQGHELHGMYGSRMALSMYDSLRLARFTHRQDALIDARIFSDGDMYAIIQYRRSYGVAYLSCGEDGLVAYDASGNPAEVNSLKLFKPAALGSLLDRDLLSGVLTPESLIKQWADAGTLRVVAEGGMWGARALVTEHWRPFIAPEDHEVPEQVTFSALLPTAQAAARYAHERVRRVAPQQTCFGFVLKHRDKEEYIVSETVGASQRERLFSLASLFRIDDNGDYLYPEYFELAGLFYARQWMPGGLGTSEAWLARHFLSSHDLYSAFHEARRRTPKGVALGLPVYISTLDGALLQFKAPATTQLFEPVVGDSGFEDVHTRLASGLLQPVDFVREVATKSYLTVLKGNSFWGAQGRQRLLETWTSHPRFARRPLSPAFTCQADAVRYARRLIAPHICQGGLILKRADGLFIATEPMEVPGENFEVSWIFPADVSVALHAPGCTIIARYRSRRQSEFPVLLSGLDKEVYRNLFSTDVLSTAMASTRLWSHEYLFTPDGAILGFTLLDEDVDLLPFARKQERITGISELEDQLKPSGDSPYDPLSNQVERRLREGVLTPTQFVTQLVGLGVLNVVEGGALWGPAQKIRRGWQPLLHVLTPVHTHLFAMTDRELSPAYAHMDDAVRHAHRRIGDRQDWVFGFILKSSRSGHYACSLPMIASEPRFPMERVFLLGQVPVGYSVHGLYLGAPSRRDEALPDSEVYRNFIAPQWLQGALLAVEVWPTKNGAHFQPLYLSCTDGALLKYEARHRDSDLFESGARLVYERTLAQGGAPEGYVHKVARAGQLTVLNNSDVWLAPGVVGQDWRPKAATDDQLTAIHRRELGPLCSHPDDAARLMWQRVRNFSVEPSLGAILGDVGRTTFMAVVPMTDRAEDKTTRSRTDTPAYRAVFGATALYPTPYRVTGVQQFYTFDEQSLRNASEADRALYRNAFDFAELRACIALLKQRGVAQARYYLTPRSGGLIAYEVSYSQEEAQVIGKVPGLSGDSGIVPAIDAALKQMSDSGRLHVLEPDFHWYPRGQSSITNGWVRKKDRSAVD